MNSKIMSRQTKKNSAMHVLRMLAVIFAAGLAISFTACSGAKNAPVTYDQRTTDKEFTAFGFTISSLYYAGSINSSTHTIAVTVPSSFTTALLDGTTTTAGRIPAPSFSISGAKLTVGSVLQESGSTEQDFRSPVVYRVYAADKSFVDYTVTVTIAGLLAAAPVASNVNITGYLKEGQTLTGNYTYADSNADAESGSTFQWYRCTDAAGSGASLISGVTSLSYTLQAADVGSYIAFQVTPVTTVSPTTGTAVMSTAKGPIVSSATNLGPSITGVTLTGTFTELYTISAAVAGYTDLEGNSAGTHQYAWYLATDSSGTGALAISGATSSTYTIASGSAAKYLACTITPVDSLGASGTAKTSSWNLVSAADTTPPVWSSGYPMTGTITGATVQLKLDIDESGTAYWIVVPAGSTTPTAAQVMAMSNYGSVTLVASGSAAKTTTATTHTISGLTEGVSYDIYSVAKDAFGNLQSDATVNSAKVTFSTADTTPPTWTTSYPAVGTMGSATAQVRASISEAGKVYAVLLANGSSMPTYNQVKAGQDASGSALAAGCIASNTSVAATTEVTLSFSGLSEATDYDVYIVAQDNATTPNTLGPTLVEVTTTSTVDTTPPTWTASYPLAGTMGLTTAQVQGSIDEAGKIYAVAVADGASAPSYAQVKAGQDASGASAIASASNTSVAASTAVTLSLSGLTASTAYDVYLAAEDNASTPNTLGPTKIDITTTAASSNLVLNPGFENDLTDWTVVGSGGGTVGTTPVNGGLKSVKFASLTSSGTGRKLQSAIFAVDTSRSIIVTANFYTSQAVANSQVGLLILFYSDSGGTTSTGTYPTSSIYSNLAATTTWGAKSFTRTAAQIPAGTTHARVEIRANYVSPGTSATPVYFDDVSATQP